LIAASVPRLARYAGVLAPVIALCALWFHSGATNMQLEPAGIELQTVRLDALAKIFALAFILFSLLANIYAWTGSQARELAVALLLAAAGVGVVIAGDLITLFFAWEWLSIASVALIWLGGTDSSQRAGLRYLFLHVVGGACLFGGVLLGPGGGSPGTLSLDGVGAWLIFAGFAVNVAALPFHAWLPDAYPRASIFGSVWLTAFTTKAAVYALARYFPGTELLMWMGIAMALYGVVFALMENDLRRLLSYHIVSQVGFMVAGVGIGTQLAVNGAVSHAFCHVIYKGLLMMSVGAIIFTTGRSRLSELGGLAKKHPALFVLFLIGAVSISGIPMFSGFVSKSMTISAAAGSDRAIIEIALIVASVGTFLSIAAKISYFAFIAPASKSLPATSSIPKPMYFAMALAAVICVGLGLAPQSLYALLPHAADYHPYSIEHVAQSLQLACASAFGFWILRDHLASGRTITRDTDRLYAGVAVLFVRCADVAIGAVRNLVESVQRGFVRAHVRARAFLLSPGANDSPIALQVIALVVLSLGLLIVVATRSAAK
jgi:multicomponent Na+:H+ antiporter subunit D